MRFTSKRTVAIGEAMIEMAIVGDDTYRRSFAGDTYNTAWHIAQIPGWDVPVGFVTKVGVDQVSDRFVAELDADGLDSLFVGRVTDRTMGLYMIELDGAERSFQYWRSASAARQLADDLDWLTTALKGAGLVHLSGITLGVLSVSARANLFEALSIAREAGAKVSFDPNVRPRLWTSDAETRDVMGQFFAVTDIALPSFDDEARLWGDTSPNDTVNRFRAYGVKEVVVKNGAGPVLAYDCTGVIAHPTLSVDGIVDTSGAGDAFNAGYLGARLCGANLAISISCGQRISAEVLRHYGARIPSGKVPELNL